MARRTFVKKIDFKEWFSIPGLLTQRASDGTEVGGSVSFAAPATLMRFRSGIQASFDETKQAGDEMNIAFGLGIFSTDAVTLGSTALPDPASEPEYPWIWWGEIFLESFVAAAAEAWGFPQQKLMVDSKAMRKVKPGQSIAWVIQTSNASGAPLTEITILQTRFLIGT